MTSYIFSLLKPYEDSIPGIPMANIYVQENRTFCFMADSGSSSVSWNEICRDRLNMGDILGQGEFGLVVKAVWRDEQTNENVTVAVKTVKGKGLVIVAKDFSD